MKTPKKPRRRAVMVQEAVMAIVVTTTVLLSVGELLGRLAHQRRLVEQRAACRQHAANLMEDALSRPWNGLTTEDLQRISTASCNPALTLPNPVQVAVEIESDSVRRIAIQIDGSGGVRPVKLVAWRHRVPEARP